MKVTSACWGDASMPFPNLYLCPKIASYDLTTLNAKYDAPPAFSSNTVWNIPMTLHAVCSSSYTTKRLLFLLSVMSNGS